MSKQALLGAAFASADLIFEVDASGLITFALGATTGIVAKENGPLTGQTWRNLFSSADQELLAALIRGVGPGERRGPLLVALASADPSKPGRAAHLSVFRLPDRASDPLSCALAIGGDAAIGPDDANGLVGEADFADVAERMLRQAEHTGANLRVDLVELEGLKAIAGWNGPGPFLIENNYLEASGENFMLGGATPGINGLIPSDVVFRRNHVTRPASWRSANWAVKNLFELKNARRVLVEGNLFETHWQDAQPGYAIVFTPRGEGGAAPWAVVEDVTFRYNVVRNVAAVFNFLARDNNGASGPLRRVKIADNLFYGVDRSAWGGNGTFLQIGEGPAEISVEHNTIMQTGNIITAYGGTRQAPTAADRFVFKDNIVLHNANGVIGTGLAIGNDTLSKYFPGAAFYRNVLAGGNASRYPADNSFPTVDWLKDQFLDAATYDYRLRPGSSLRQSGSDSRDVGVGYTALIEGIGANAAALLGLPEPSPPVPPDRLKDRAKGRPPAYIRPGSGRQ